MKMKQSRLCFVIFTSQIHHMAMLERLNQYDQQAFALVFIQDQRAAVVRTANILSRSGEGYLHLLTLIVAWQLQLSVFTALAVLTLTAFTLERCLHKLLKRSFQRPRPEAAFSGLNRLGCASSTFSFPSGHSSRAFLLATVLFVTFGKMAVITFVWASAVAISRVVLGAHYPGDILAGAAVGCCITLVTALALGLL